MFSLSRFSVTADDDDGETAFVLSSEGGTSSTREGDCLGDWESVVMRASIMLILILDDSPTLATGAGASPGNE